MLARLVEAAEDNRNLSVHRNFFVGLHTSDGESKAPADFRAVLLKKYERSVIFYKKNRTSGILNIQLF